MNRDEYEATMLQINVGRRQAEQILRESEGVSTLTHYMVTIIIMAVYVLAMCVVALIMLANS